MQQAASGRCHRGWHPLYQLLAVHYVLGPPKMRSGPGWRAVFLDPMIRVFERTQVLPQLFLPESTEAGVRDWGQWLEEHRVEMVYRAPGFLAGLVIAAVAVVALLGWVAPPAHSLPLSFALLSAKRGRHVLTLVQDKHKGRERPPAYKGPAGDSSGGELSSESLLT